jgi:putative ABC transport system permease protein
MASEIVQTIRALRSHRAMAAAVVVSLGLGLGANAAVFSVVRGVVLKALPYPQVDRIVQIDRAATAAEASGIIGPMFQRWRASTERFAAMGALLRRSVPVGTALRTEEVEAAEVTPEFFEVFSVQPSLGHIFQAEEGVRTAVLGRVLWRRLYGDGAVPPQTILVDGEPYTVVGVLPSEFTFPGRTELWTPLPIEPEGLIRWQLPQGVTGVRIAPLEVVARLRDGATIEGAVAEGTTILFRDAPGGARARLRIRPLQDVTVGPVRPMLLALQGAVLLLLALTCANVASLLVTRGEARRGELAVRVALGASGGRLARQALAEALLLTSAGAAVALLLAVWGLGLLKTMAPATMPRVDEVRLDGGVLAAMVALALVTGLACGLLPAWRALRQAGDIRPLRRGGPSAARAGSTRPGPVLRGLAVVQFAVSIVLLAAAFGLGASVWRLARLDPGFAARRVMTGRVTVPLAKHTSPQSRVALLERLLAEVRAVPGVTGVALTDDLPFAGGDPRTLVRLEGSEAGVWGGEPPARQRIVAGEYFRLLGVDLVAGRLLAPDEPAASPAVVVNEAFVLQNMGRREIVGVVRDMKEMSLVEDPFPTIYQPLASFTTQHPRFIWVAMRLAAPYLLVEAKLAWERVLPVVRARVAAIDPELVLGDWRTLGDRVAASYAPMTFAATLMGAFGLLALATAATGLSGLLAYLVSRRTREFGVRLAFGATPRALEHLVLREGGAIVGAGVALGLLGAWQAGRVARAVSAELAGHGRETPALAAAVGVLALTALAAAWLPARRAGAVDPIRALREE